MAADTHNEAGCPGGLRRRNRFSIVDRTRDAMNLRNWKIGRKLAALAATGLVIAVVIGAISYASVGQIGTLTNSSAELAAADQTLRQLDMDQSDMQVASRDLLLSVENSTAVTAQKWFGTTAESATQSWTTM
jgi:hypothetical protein